MRLNLGCGNKKLDGWVNVDKFGEPDQRVDLDLLPWPWESDSVEAVQLIHVLEHLGREPDTYIGIMKELWRVCRHGAKIVIVVPHPRHDDFLGDPTHVRAVTPDGIALFSKRMNLKMQAAGGANTPLALYHGIDLDLVGFTMELDPLWEGRMKRGEIRESQLQEFERTYNNVVKQIKIELRAEKQG